MRVPFDQATPVPIRAYLDGHDVSTAFQQGWATLKNGDLLTAAEATGFDGRIERRGGVKIYVAGQAGRS
jgi:hypothetical protein